MSHSHSHDHDHCDHHEHESNSWWHEFLPPVACLTMVLAGLGLDSAFPSTSPLRVAIVAYALAFVAGGYGPLMESAELLRRGRLGIDLLMLLAALAAAALGDWAEGGVLLFLFSLSHALEHVIMARTRAAVSKLLQLTPQTARRIREGREDVVPVTEVRPGDLVVVHPSERIPVDGEVHSGETSVDQAPVTGESMPVDKEAGAPVFAGTLNLQGSIVVISRRIASETTLARMVKLVSEAQSSKAPVERFTSWFGERYTLAVLLGTATAFLVGYWGLRLSFHHAAYQAMVLMVAASPCAVVLSIPAAILAAIAAAARAGILFKGGTHLEATASLKAMMFDKTGTLTIGKPRVVEINTAVSGFTPDDLLQRAAAVEQHSEHPLAQAILTAARERELEIPPATKVVAATAMGISGEVHQQRVEVGRQQWFTDRSLMFPQHLAEMLDTMRQKGQTVMVVAENGRELGAVGVTDTVRPTAAAAIAELRELGIAPLQLLTGDHRLAAEPLARELLLTVQAELFPAQKLEAVRQLQQSVGPVGMVGDGVNDAPALATADVGFSLGGAATDVALETAGVVVMADDLRRIPFAIRLARGATAILWQNLAISFATMALLIAAALSFHLPLPVAVFAHEGSTVLVILNGLRMFAWRFRQPVVATPAVAR